MSRIFTLIFALCFLVPFGFSQEQDFKIIEVSDQGANVSGACTVKDYSGTPPPSSSGNRAISQMPGWPITVGVHPNFKPSRGLVFADLDNNGALEIIVSSTDSKIYAWDYTGTPMPGFPVTTIAWPQYAPTVGDMDGDGNMEIAQFTRGMTSGGRFYLLNNKGQNLPGFPKNINNNNLASCPTMYDLDNDGTMEIFVPERSYPIGYLRVFEMNGSEWGGNWPVTLDHVPTGSPAVGDLDGDGAVEIVYMSYNSIYVLEVDGTNVPNWPKQINNCNFSYQSPALGDLDGDGDLEIVIGAHKTNAGCYIFHHDGTAFPGWPKLLGTWTYCPPTITDLEGDGALEILDGRAGGFGGYSNCFWAWTTSGATKPGFPYSMAHGGGSEGPLTVADINNDGKMEIFADHNIMESATGQGYLFGVDSNGNDLQDFPLRPQGFTYMNGAVINDVDGDGDYELGVISYGDYTADINLYDLKGTYHPSEVSWETYHKKSTRGGLHKSENKVTLQGEVSLNSNINLYIHGDPGLRAYLWVSLAGAKFYSNTYGWFYTSFAPPSPFILFNNALIPASMELKMGITIPNDPALPGLSFYFQGATGIDPNNGLGKTTNMVKITVP